ncbi:hypothetical protein ACSBR2_034585 [Camellia fascicularis]
MHLNKKFTISMATTALLYPSIPPAVSQKDQISLSSDRRFAVHGEIMMLILVIFFVFFLASIVLFLCWKRSYDTVKLGQLELMESKNSPFPIFYGTINTGLKSLHQSDQDRESSSMKIHQNPTNQSSPRYG